jgi:hypothetical protein
MDLGKPYGSSSLFGRRGCSSERCIYILRDLYGNLKQEKGT